MKNINIPIDWSWKQTVLFKFRLNIKYKFIKENNRHQKLFKIFCLRGIIGFVLMSVASPSNFFLILVHLEAYYLNSFFLSFLQKIKVSQVWQHMSAVIKRISSLTCFIISHPFSFQFLGKFSLMLDTN